MNSPCVAETAYPGHSAPPLFAPQDEQRWLLRYLPLVKRIVSQLALQASSTLDREDMEQIGLLGLLDSLRRYGEPDEAFGRFASLRIRGAILDELRRQDWRPRQVRQQSHKMRDGVRALARQLGREPSDEEIRTHLGVDEDAYHAYLLDQSGEAIESLDALLQDGHEPNANVTEGFEQRVHQERLLAQVLGRLSEREQLVLTLYYQHDLSLKEIALVLDLSDARICQLIKQAVKRACVFLTEPN
ncbi:FliA/WhiG family RNA polymerase sigma factor [Pseudomonas sp.]|uniref:FliA/WhiG family RNA polymerase sigma factor n=1 Tax=Pseudomonas sp. TaxID=306 RepID=UPI0019E5B989|nr:FliA/WhiG family RNA polymerase sigma factor [Pseudomonas sp.]MBF0676712.1 FliA/WhiG family RNA polymerase sigma factor [Pseudomonas sp.]